MAIVMNKKNNEPSWDDDRRTKMLDDDSPIDELDEQLVAYLDGELATLERDVLESRLGRDPELRNRLRTLQNGWDMLDELPMATPSPILLESTIRMAAIEASQGIAAKPTTGGIVSNHWLKSKFFWAALMTVAFFGVGMAAARVRERQQFRSQLAQLPVAMHVDAYLNATDLPLMRTLMQLPQWQDAVQIAERFGEWDFALHGRIDQATVSERVQLLQELPIEHQQVVMQAWQRFEKLEPEVKAAAIDVAKRVADQPDSQEVLATMDRFARWRETLAPGQRDLIASGDAQGRIRAIEESLEKTVSQWTQQTTRLLNDEDVETIYQVLRQIARLRIQSIDFSDVPIAAAGLRSFGSKDQNMEPRMEAFFLRRIFDPYDQPPPPPAPPTGTAGMNRPGPPPTGFEFMAPALGAIRPLLEKLRAPLHDDELWMIESVLSEELAGFLSAASRIELLREKLLRIWADESLRRIESSRSGRTISERYELIDPSRRDQLDLLAPDKILESLRFEDRRRRP